MLVRRRHTGVSHLGLTNQRAKHILVDILEGEQQFNK